ncbi:hypothetical protein CNR22_17175 [Sphingobacteriaceae bacterium]|nr:hypothetical protein CNR22_17175 [Sphingobacteriaceae bacterium]
MNFFRYKSPVLLFLISFLIFGFSVKMKRVSCDDILLRSRIALLNVKSVNYDCNFVQKFAGGNDTLKTSATISMERESVDTLLGCKMKMTSQFQFYAITFKTELFYNGKKNITMNHTRKKATIDTVGPRGKGKPTMSLLKQNFPTANLMNHYTEKIPYEPFFKKSNKIKMLEEEKVGNYVCYKIEIISQDPDRKKRITNIYIDKKSFLPVRRMDSVDFQNKYQYSNFSLSAIKINDSKIASSIKEPIVPKGYDIDYHRLDRY